MVTKRSQQPYSHIQKAEYGVTCVFIKWLYCSPMLPHPAQCNSWNSANKT